MIQNGLAFLDTLNKVNEDGYIDISVYRKPTHTDRYLQFDSHQPIQHKASVVKSLYPRAAKASSNPHNRKSEVEFVTKVLKSNGYPKKFLRKQRRQIFNKINNIIETADNIEGSDNENKRVDPPVHSEYHREIEANFTKI